MNFIRPGPFARRLFAAFAGLGLLLSAAGCFSEAESPAGRIVITSQPYFTDKPGEVVGPLVVQALSPPVRGIPGRNGFRDPVVGRPVKFEVRETAHPGPLPRLIFKSQNTQSTPRQAEEKKEAGSEPVKGRPDSKEAPATESGAAATQRAGTDSGSKVAANTEDHKTDKDGFFKVWVRLPMAIGEWRVRAEVRDQFDNLKRVEFVVASGAKIFESGAEGLVGRKVPIAIQLFQIDLDRNTAGPAIDYPVHFRIAGEPNGAHLGRDLLVDRVRTNEQGVAAADLILGSRSGIYTVIAEPKADQPLAGEVFPAMALHGIAVDWDQATGFLLGGVLLFLLGLRFLGSGLLNLLGPAVTLPVTTLSRGQLRGFCGGLAAGAMFQSSTSVTSRLISFANGGLLTSAGAAGMVLGADVGRTLLPQILAFPIEPAAVPLLVVGAIGLFLPRRLGLTGWGWFLLGCGLVAYGHVILQDGVDVLRFSPSLREHFAGWNYLDRGEAASSAASAWMFISALGAAAAAGVILRSSNLPVVLAVVLAGSGEASLIPPSLALPIVLGANLGPSIVLAATGFRKRVEARRLAVSQFLFQIVGTAWFLVLSLATVDGQPLMLHLSDSLTPGFLFHPPPENLGHHIATVHTLYNLLNAAVCFALIRPLLKLTDRLAPRDAVRDDLKPYNLDPNLLEVPALALLQATREVTYLVELTRKAIAESLDAFRYKDLKLADQTSRREETADSVHRGLSQYLLKVGENDLSARESSRLQILQATTGNLVRVGEIGERLRDLTTRAIDENIELTEEVSRDFNEIYDLVMAQFDNVLQLIERPDGRTEENTVKVAERLAKFESRIEHNWAEKLRAAVSGTAGPAATPAATKTGSEKPAEASPHPVGLLIFREGMQRLFDVGAHLAHIAERMRVLGARS